MLVSHMWSAMEADDFHENEKYLVIPSDQYKKTRELEHERVFEHFAELSILVAEDNAVNRLVMAEKLKQLGCDVTFVENGETPTTLFASMNMMLFFATVTCQNSMDLSLPKS